MVDPGVHPLWCWCVATCVSLLLNPYVFLVTDVFILSLSAQKLDLVQTSGLPSMTRWLSLLPSDSPHPLCPFLNIVSLTDPLNGMPIPCQFLIGGHPMYEAVACSTQPGYTVQDMLLVPASLQNLSMNAARY